MVCAGQRAFSESTLYDERWRLVVLAPIRLLLAAKSIFWVSGSWHDVAVIVRVKSLWTIRKFIDEIASILSSMKLPRLPGAMHLLKDELGEADTNPWTAGRDPFGEHAEASLLAQYVPRAMSSFSSDYSGSHIQTLPAELLQAIALQISGHGSTMSKHFGKFRMLCRESSEAGKALLVAQGYRNRYSVPYTLYLPPIDMSLADLTKTFTNNKLASVVRHIQFTFRPLITHKHLKDVLLRARSLFSSNNAQVIADRVIHEFHTQIERQEPFVRDLLSETGFLQILQLLDLFPHLEELTYRVLAYWRLIHDSDTTEELVNTPRSNVQVIHWQALPRIMEIVKHCGITSFNVDADSAMFGNPSQRTGLPERSNRRSGVLNKLSLPGYLNHITTIDLTLTKHDTMSIGRCYEEDLLDLRNAQGFRDFLMCAINLKRFHLEYTIEEGQGEHRHGLASGAPSWDALSCPTHV